MKKTVNQWITHAAARHTVQLLQCFVKQGFSALASFKQTTLDNFSLALLFVIMTVNVCDVMSEVCLFGSVDILG